MKRIIKFFQDKEKRALVAFFLLSLIILITRHPHAIFEAQFWAEDGAYWYVDAYQLGFLRSVFLPSVGYFQTLSRLIAGIALVFPLQDAPLFMNLSALMVQTIPALLLVSSRFSRHVPDIRHRFLIAFLYLLMPNSAEMHANSTNAQWYLALAATLVYLGGPAKTQVSRFVDVAVTSLSALSGPFIIFLAPVAVLQWWRERVFWKKVLALIAVIGALVQMTGIIFLDAGSRISVLPERSIELLLAILEKQIFLGSVLGRGGYALIISWGSLGQFLAHLSLVGGILIIGYALWKAKIELRILIALSFALLGAGMLSPTIGGEDRVLDSVKNGWELLFMSSSGIRYWMMGIFAFHVTLIWAMRRANPFAIRIIALLFLALLSIGVVKDFRDPQFIEQNFTSRALLFHEEVPGTVVEIPLNPPGWSMELIKK